MHRRRRTTSVAPRPLPPSSSPPGEWLQEVLNKKPWGAFFLSVLATFQLLQFGASHAVWLKSFSSDFAGWLGDPRIARGPSLHLDAGVGLAVVVTGLGISIGWLASALALRGTRVAQDRILRAGFAIVFAIAGLGYPAVLCVVVGQLTAQALWPLLTVMVSVLALFWRRSATGANATVPPASEGRGRVPRICFAAFCILIIGLIATHAIMSSILEWDAIVYHAETARLWFLTRPAPPLSFGPSVGIEISVNYPPLFPATGAAFYTLLGRVDDLYLRLVSPASLAAVVLLLFGWVRLRWDASTARLAVVLVLGAPLTVMYGAWATSYMLLCALFLGAVILLDLSAAGGSRWTWVAAGAVAGLAALTSFYGAITVIAGLATWVFRRQSREQVLAFVATAAVVAAPWLLRNLFLLHDPFYPLGSPPFRGLGLVGTIWQLSKDEIRNNALGYWKADILLRLRLLLTLGFDRHLPPLGSGIGAVLAIAAWRRSRHAAYVASVLALFGLALWAPGWFWIRALLGTTPLAASLSALMLLALYRAHRRPVEGPRRSALPQALARLGSASALVLAVSFSVVIGLASAIAGPNHRTWITNLGPADDVMSGVEAWGDAGAQRWAVFGGDALLWEWINREATIGTRVATLEIRTYTLDRPSDLFFLDGREAMPLLDLQSSEATEEFLRQQGVAYVVLPAWTVDGPSRHPIVDELALFSYLGTEWFPAVAAFPTGASEVPSMVYSVGATDQTATVGVFPGLGQPEPDASGGAVILADAVDARIAVPLRSGDWALEFSYDRSSPGAFDVNLFDPQQGTWQILSSGNRDGSASWARCRLFLPVSSHYAMLGIHVYDAPLAIRDLRVVRIRSTGGGCST